MQHDYVKAYSQAGELLAILENAGEIAYNLPHNDLWTASFTLPSSDPKNAHCQAHNLVRVPDGMRDLGLYRIVGMPTSEETATGGVKTYSLEHVMATLLDDVLFGYHEIGGPGVDTAQVIRYILAQQTTQRWVLGVCEYADQLAYKFENTSLLSALISLGNVLTDEYTWDFDTSSTPWTVNLRRADMSPGCGIHYMRNMVGIEKTMDATTLVTRLYLLGYGEGVNQLTIREVNNGLPYIDADTVGVWGIKASVYADTRIEDAATLKARGLNVLDRYKNPYISYTASAIDLTRLTGQEWDKHMPGKLVRVMDSEHGINFTARIVNISKENVRGRPGEIEITIANAPRDAADSINTLADRMGISELYSQGATNLYSQQYADNADANHPARMRVYVPSGCVRINQMLLSWQLDAFRAYETGAAAGGATATTTQSGGSSTSTSSAGGASERTSRSGGAYAQTLAQKVITTQASTGGTIAGHEGDTSGNTGYALNSSGNTMSSTGATSGNTGTPIGTASNASMTETGTGGPLFTGDSGSGSTGNASGNTGVPISTVGGSTMTSTGTGGPTTTGKSSPGTDEAGSDASTSGAKNNDGAVSNTGSSSPGTNGSGSHSHTVNSHSHSFSGSDSLSWGHTHSTSSSFEAGKSTGGVDKYSAKTIEISGTTGTKSPGTSTADTHTHTVNSHTHSMAHYHTLSTKHSHTVAEHSHSVDQHSHGMNHYHDMGSHNHSLNNHKHSVDQHSHGMNHYHDMGSHSHGMAHYHNFSHSHNVVAVVDIPAQEITIPAHSHVFETSNHTHSVSIEAHTHDLTLADHTHGIVYGIYEGDTASSVTLKVDGNTVPDSEIKSDEMDIVGYLAKDEDGKIMRGTWHEIEIVPNGLTRIEANLFVQTFVQSVGGGDY